jgi:hypothetical protein
MRSLPIVLCLLAVLGALLSATLYFRIGNSKKLLQAQLATASARAADLSARLAQAGAQNESLEKHLTALDSDLGETKSRLTATDARNLQLARELAQTRSLAAAHEQNERALAAQNTALGRDLAAARAAAVSPETVEAYKATIADLERELANARHGAALTAAAGASTAVFATRPAEPPAPASLTATVVSVGPESAFVVLDCGSAQGAAAGQVFSIQRGTEVIATALISDVRPNFSVAQVQPDTLHGALHKGDSALLTQ